MEEKKTNWFLLPAELERAAKTLNMTKTNAIRYVLRNADKIPLVEDVADVTMNDATESVSTLYFPELMEKAKELIKQKYAILPSMALTVNVLLVSFNRKNENDGK